jgi:hypothetical protein
MKRNGKMKFLSFCPIAKMMPGGLIVVDLMSLALRFLFIALFPFAVVGWRGNSFNQIISLQLAHN